MRTKRLRLYRIVLCELSGILILATLSKGQEPVSTFPYVERFDTVTTPALPAGWQTSTLRTAGGDFVSTTSSPRSAPNALLSTNSTVPQYLISPRFDFAGKAPVKLEFFLARSGTHLSGVLIEASLDDGGSFPIVLGDTLFNPGVTGYQPVSLLLPAILADQPRVRIRWRTIGGTGGTAGTLRLDDVLLTTAVTHDLGLTGLAPLFQSQPTDGQIQKFRGLQAKVRNTGRVSASGYTILFFRDVNDNAVADPHEQIHAVPGAVLSVGDSASIEAAVSVPGPGTHRWMAVVSYLPDTNPANDTAAVTVRLPAEPRSLIINEIMFDPLTGQNEWVEFFNRSPDTVDLAGWRFSDRPTAGGSINSFVMTSTSSAAPPASFIVAAAESSIFNHFPLLGSTSHARKVFILNRTSGLSFGNDGDGLVLVDHLGITIDSVSYSASWHHPDIANARGRSLERINPDLASNDPRNWSTSASLAGGTPGERNSIHTVSLPTHASLSFHPNPFSPDGDGFEDFCIIRYNLPLTTSLIRISVFDRRGRMIRTLANSELAGPSGEIIWDGLDGEQQRARIGPYIVYIEAIDGQGGIIATAKGVVVVATRL